jgi:hypothetical protein
MKRIVMAIVLLVLPSTSGAAAARADGEASLETIVKRVAELGDQGAHWPVIESVLKQEFGLRVLQGAPVADARNSPGPNDVTLTTPVLTSRESEDSPYIMLGDMHWNMCGGRPCWQKDSGGNKAGDHGGPDGFAIQTSRPIVRVSSYMIRTNSCGKQEDIDQPSTDTKHGVGFKIQDGVGGKGCRTGWNWSKAYIGNEFRFEDGRGYCTGGNPPYNVQTMFTHTWDTTALNSIGISESGISFSWNDKPHHYEVIPPAAWNSDC